MGILTSWPVLGLGVAGVSLYGLSTILWIIVLQSVPISRAYPFFALGFVLIPISGVLFFGESISVSQFIGISLIVFGVACVGVMR